MTDAGRKLQLDVHPSVVFQLGEQLISDELTAIIELVKNSYDADASFAHVEIDTRVITTEETSFFEGCLGQAIISDDGTGMDLEDIQRGWLRISDSPKRQVKQSGKVTPIYRRTPLGDKGLGRLGVQRLGDVVEIFTRKTKVEPSEDLDNDKPRYRRVRQPTEYHIGIDWRELGKSETLSGVTVHSEELFDTRRTGTKVVISSLKNQAVWANRDAIIRLQQRLGQLIFPFAHQRTFAVSAVVDGERLEIEGVSEETRNFAIASFEFSYSKGALTVKSRLSPVMLRGTNRGDVTEFDRFIGSDNGLAFWQHLKGKPRFVERHQLQFVGSDRQFVTATVRRGLDNRIAHIEDGQVADPGPFSGEIDLYDLSSPTLKEYASQALGRLNELVRQHSGVRVFRDGFAIRPYGIDGDDWLQLGKRWTTGASFYGLRPSNVIGYVQLSAEDNRQLHEKTDREGFVESPYSKNFFDLMQAVTKACNDLIEDLRREYVAFKRPRAIGKSGHHDLASPDELLDRIRTTASRADRIKDEADSAIKVIEEYTPTGPNHSLVNASDAIDAAEPLKNSLQMISDFAQTVATLRADANALSEDLQLIQDQLDGFAQLAAVGLTVEVLAHELRSIATTLEQDSRRILDALKKKPPTSAETVSYVERVRTAVRSIRKELQQLQPGLRYARETTEAIGMRRFLTEFVDFHRRSFSRTNIRLELVEPFQDFTVRMNRGKLNQVFLNLLLNSRYWLTRDLERKLIDEAVFYVRPHGGSVDVWDTGQGIDPSVADALFEPFITTKRRGEGQGLGLFVVREFLRGSGGSVQLLPDRNEYGRQFRFRLDFGGSIDGRREAESGSAEPSAIAAQSGQSRMY